MKQNASMRLYLWPGPAVVSSHVYFRVSKLKQARYGVANVALVLVSWWDAIVFDNHRLNFRIRSRCHVVVWNRRRVFTCLFRSSRGKFVRNHFKDFCLNPPWYGESAITWTKVHRVGLTRQSLFLLGLTLTKKFYRRLWDRVFRKNTWVPKNRKINEVNCGLLARNMLPVAMSSTSSGDEETSQLLMSYQASGPPLNLYSP